MRDETKKKAREEHYPAPFRLIDLFEQHGGDLEALKAAETAIFRAAPGLGSARATCAACSSCPSCSRARPRRIELEAARAHVIGAGTMGADIAGWCVASGMEVTLQDVSPEQITEKGIKAQGKLFAKQVQDQGAEATRPRRASSPIRPGRAQLHADVIIEAIVERLDIKQKLFAELEDKIKPGAVLATNTSSLEIEAIAAPLNDPGRLIGIHFFNPVALMPLVEVVRGAQSRETEVKKAPPSSPPSASSRSSPRACRASWSTACSLPT